jgi:hypothetical protein
VSKCLIIPIDHQSLAGFAVLQRIRLNIDGIFETTKVDEKAGRLIGIHEILSKMNIIFRGG